MQKNMKSKLNAHGSRTFFDVGEHVIEVFMSSYSGKEVVLVDGVELSSRRNWRYRSSHEFELDGERYTVAIIIASLLKGQARVELTRNGEYLDHDELDWNQFFNPKPQQPVSRVRAILSFLFWLLAGGVFGYYSVKWIGSLFGAGDVG